MNLKKNLKSKKSQSIVEYIVIFTVLAAAILAVFGAFNPEHIGIKSVFEQEVTRTIEELNK